MDRIDTRIRPRSSATGWMTAYSYMCVYIYIYILMSIIYHDTYDEMARLNEIPFRSGSFNTEK